MTHIHPDKLRPLGLRIMVKVYERPAETASGLIIPGSHRRDKSWTLYEVVRSTPEVTDELDMELQEGDILKTKISIPTDTGFLDERDGRRLFFIGPDRIQHVQVCTWEVH
jgi:co-chaperonin GroES (HSP10)